MAKHETDHRTGSQRSDAPLETDTAKSRAGMWFIAVLLPAIIVGTAIFMWSNQLGDDTPPVDDPEPVPAPEIAE